MNGQFDLDMAQCDRTFRKFGAEGHLMLRSNDRAIAMLNRTSPKRLTFIVLALLLGILIGLAIFPAGDLAGAGLAIDCASVTGITESECLALKALFDDTNGTGWANNSGWQDTTTPCTTWHGITCGSGQVTRIELPNNNLSGPLPADVSDLSQLQVLLLYLVVLV